MLLASALVGLALCGLRGLLLAVIHPPTEISVLWEQRG